MQIDFKNDGTMMIQPSNGVEAMALRYWTAKHGNNMAEMITVETSVTKHGDEDEED